MYIGRYSTNEMSATVASTLCCYLFLAVVSSSGSAASSTKTDGEMTTLCSSQVEVASVSPGHGLGYNPTELKNGNGFSKRKIIIPRRSSSKRRECEKTAKNHSVLSDRRSTE